MEVKVEDLLVGDVVLILSQVPKCIKIVNKPIQGPSKQWAPNTPWFKSLNVKVNMKMDVVTRTRWDYKTKTYIPFNHTEKVYVLDTPPVDAPIVRLDLNHKKFWLISRSAIL
jgi:hypothetical protein